MLETTSSQLIACEDINVNLFLTTDSEITLK